MLKSKKCYSKNKLFDFQLRFIKNITIKRDIGPREDELRELPQTPREALSVLFLEPTIFCLLSSVLTMQPRLPLSGQSRSVAKIS